MVYLTLFLLLFFWNLIQLFGKCWITISPYGVTVVFEILNVEHVGVCDNLETYNAVWNVFFNNFGKHR